jgi:DNA-directed RNA polymerase omega subunit
MPYVALEKLLDESGGSIYKLVVLASKRALEIAEGQPKLVDVSASNKPSTIALYEIAEGKVKYQKSKPEK